MKDQDVVSTFEKDGITGSNFDLIKQLDSLNIKNNIYSQFVAPLEQVDLELFYKCHIYLNLNQYADTLSQLDRIVKMEESLQLEIALLLVDSEQFHADAAMLLLYKFYKNNPQENFLFYLEVLNRFRMYTPEYLKLVWNQAQKINLENEVKKKSPLISPRIVQALINSPVKPQECAQWCLTFIEAWLKNTDGTIILNMRPNLSRSENNLSLLSFKNKNEFEQYLSNHGQEFSKNFFMYYFDFSHLYETKESYLSALKKLSGSKQDWPWYGSIHH